MRINQVTRGRTLRTSTRIAALLGAAALATAGPAIAYAATQPPQPPRAQTTVTAQESASASPTGIADSPTASAEPTVIITQPSIPDLPTPTQSSDGGVGGGAGAGTGGQGTVTNNNKATNANTTKKPVRSVTTTSANDTLPTTGSKISNVVVLGAVLTVGGVGLVATARRRRRAN